MNTYNPRNQTRKWKQICLYILREKQAGTQSRGPRRYHACLIQRYLLPLRASVPAVTQPEVCKRFTVCGTRESVAKRREWRTSKGQHTFKVWIPAWVCVRYLSKHQLTPSWRLSRTGSDTAEFLPFIMSLWLHIIRDWQCQCKTSHFCRAVCWLNVIKSRLLH